MDISTTPKKDQTQSSGTWAFLTKSVLKEAPVLRNAFEEKYEKKQAEDNLEQYRSKMRRKALAELQRVQELKKAKRL